MSYLQLWHNPDCSKSRETLFMLRDKGYDPDLRLYLKDPPSIHQLQQLLIKLNTPALAMMRPNEPRFAQLGLTKSTDEQTLIAAMAAHPDLIQRPILISKTNAAIGRPPLSVLSILPQTPTN